MKDFSQAVERFVQSTNNGDFVTNLHTIYKQIQASSPDDVIATFNTLSAMKRASLHSNSLGSKGNVAVNAQIDEMQKACVGRAVQLVLMDKRANGWIGKIFDSMTLMDLNVSNGRQLIKAVI